MKALRNLLARFDSLWDKEPCSTSAFAQYQSSGGWGKDDKAENGFTGHHYQLRQPGELIPGCSEMCQCNHTHEGITDLILNNYMGGFFAIYIIFYRFISFPRHYFLPCHFLTLVWYRVLCSRFPFACFLWEDSICLPIKQNISKRNLSSITMWKGKWSCSFGHRSSSVLFLQLLGQCRAGTCLEMIENNVSQEGMFLYSFIHHSVAQYQCHSMQQQQGMERRRALRPFWGSTTGLGLSDLPSKWAKIQILS